MNQNTVVGPQKIDPHLTSKIVRSYVSHHTIGAGEVSGLITSIHGALSQLGQAQANELQQVLAPAVPVRQSVRHDHVVCLSCGYRAKMLRRHISTQHSLSPDEYRRRWGLRTDHPLTAPAYSEHRSAMAKAVGFGRNPKARVASSVTLSALSSAQADLKSDRKPARSRSPRSGSKSDAAREAAVENPPTRSRRSRSKN
jgi:predicted transcriptional regulator